MKLPPLGIRARLTLIYVLCLTIVLVGFAALSYRILKNRLDSTLSQELADRAAALRGYLRFENGGVSLSYDANDPEEAYFVQVSTRYYQIYDAVGGGLLAQSAELHLLGLELTPDEVHTIVKGEPFRDVQTDQGSLRFRNEILKPAQGETYLFQIGESMSQMDDVLRHFFQLLLWLIPASIGVTSLIGWWAARSALRPLSLLSSNIEQVGIADLTRRLPLRGTKDELDRLSVAFNEMFARLGRTIDEMKQFTASISHELRTPLAVLRGEAEVVLMQSTSEEDYRRVIASQLEEFDKLTRMINQLLTLARAEAGEIALDFRAVDLCSLGKSLTEQLVPVAESGGVTLRMECNASNVLVRADANWIERVILNLVDNAIKFTTAGGTVIVRVEPAADGGVLEVRDTGSGISSEAMPHIFERFYQADSARPSGQGAGLGLSLAKWVVDQHGGRIEVTSDPGSGSSFRLILPSIKTS